MDQLGTTIFEGSNVHQASTPLQAECWPIWDALNKAAHLNLHNIVVKSDSIEAVKICNKISPVQWYLRSLCLDIFKLSEAVDVSCFEPVNRENSVIAHNLAKHARLFCTPPGSEEFL